MKILSYALFPLSIVLVSTGCPSPPDAITTIDGLEGGTLTTGVVAPTVAADSATVGGLSVTTLTAEATTTATLDAQESTLGEASSTSLDTVTLTVTDSADIVNLTAETLAAESVTTDSASAGVLVAGALRLKSTGVYDDGSLIGQVVGVTSTGGGSYEIVDRDCFNTFAGSHICGEVDILHFLRSGNFAARVEALTASALEGASFATVTHSVIGFDTNGQPIIADDCDSWRRISIAGAPPGLHARHVVSIEDLGGSAVFGRVSTSNRCTLDDLRILCCGQ
jgi:hypothetical protein